MSLQYSFYYDGEYKSGHKDTLRFVPTFIKFKNSIYLAAQNDRGIPLKHFKGTIDEVRIYKRVLTQTEVSKNYESRIGYSVEPTVKLSIIWGSLKSKKNRLQFKLTFSEVALKDKKDYCLFDSITFNSIHIQMYTQTRFIRQVYCTVLQVHTATRQIINSNMW